MTWLAPALTQSAPAPALTRVNPKDEELKPEENCFIEDQTDGATEILLTLDKRIIDLTNDIASVKTNFTKLISATHHNALVLMDDQL